MIERGMDKRGYAGQLYKKHYLIGAPLDWAGFSRMVIVVSVSFSGVSDSYSGIMGAAVKKTYV